MARPSLAVIVPVLNEATALADLLPRLVVLPVSELVFVDGSSTDESRQILTEAGVVWLAAERGRAAQMNAGAAMCRSDVLLFLHADTLIDSSHIQAVREAMENADTVAGRFDVRLSSEQPAFRLISWFINMRSRLSRISTGDQAMFVRRAVFIRLGGFPEQPLMEDIALSRQLKRLGDIACLRQQVTTSARRWQSHGIIRTVLLMWKLRLLYWLGVPAEKLATMYREAR